MMHTRSNILERFAAKIAAGRPIIGAGAGTGISAKCEEAGGVDLIIVYNSGRFRMAGCSSMAGMLAYGNANQTVRELAPEILAAVKHTPVLAGVCGTDPFLLRTHFLQELRDLGFTGIQNFPTVGLIDGQFRKNLEETGIGYGLEVDCIAEAHAMDFLTVPYVFDNEQARAMTAAAADAVVVHMGLTTMGMIGAHTSEIPVQMRRRDPRDCRCRQGSARSGLGFVPRRTNRKSRGRTVHAGPLLSDRRVLRGQLHGTPTDGDGHF